MGMYTSLRGVVKVKKEYIDLADHISTYNDKELEKDNSKYPFLARFYKTERSENIPSNNELQWQFKDEEDFFVSRVEGNLFYFRADLKNYEDEKTGKNPIDSFMNDVLVEISEEILLLETATDYLEAVNQYNFSKDVVNTVVVVNVTNTEKESFYGIVLEDDKDVFEEFKLKNNLSVFC